MENDDSDVDVPAHSIQIVDPQVVKRWYTPDQSLIQPAKMRHPELPPGTNVAGITTHSSSLWTRTARIDTVVNGHAVRYFLKATFGERGRKMVYGEFIAMTRMHRASPMLVPKPLACGTYETIPDVHFFLCEFRDMDNKLPDIERFPAAVAKMHRNAASPDGRYGFDCTTYHGNVPIEHGWSDSWEAYFARTTRVLFDMEQEVRGTNEEIIRLSEPFFDKVVPRLLRPLDQQPIKPTLVHGDLWHGNAAMDKETSRPIIYDAAGFYAHNEYELAVWRQPWNKIGAPYRAKYREHFAPSQPEEDFDDRGMLYSTRVNLLDSILFKNDDSYRQMIISCMRELVEKFPGGYDEWYNLQAHIQGTS